MITETDKNLIASLVNPILRDHPEAMKYARRRKNEQVVSNRGSGLLQNPYIHAGFYHEYFETFCNQVAAAMIRVVDETFLITDANESVVELLRYFRNAVLPVEAEVRGLLAPIINNIGRLTIPTFAEHSQAVLSANETEIRMACARNMKQQVVKAAVEQTIHNYLNGPNSRVNVQSVDYSVNSN